MGRAFRSDLVESAQIAPEIATLEQRVDILEPETVNCPVDGCNVQYEMYNYMFSDREANLNVLRYGLRIHHPEHPAKFVLNEPRTT
jgi:hypothetical protein